MKEGWAAQVYEVRAEHLTDESGTLLDFVKRVTADGLLIQDIHVGTKDAEGIPVQIFAVSVPPAGRSRKRPGRQPATSPGRPSRRRRPGRPWPRSWPPRSGC